MFTSIDQDLRETGGKERAQPSAAPAYAGPDRRRNVAAGFDPVFVGRFVWRCRWLVASTTLAGLAFAATLAVTTPKTWLSGTQILVDPRDLKVVQNEVAPNALPSDATLALIESQTAIATSDRVLSQVIASARLVADPEFNGEGKQGLLTLLPEGMRKALTAGPPADPRETDAHVNEALRKAITVAREPKSFIVNLSLTTQDAEKSARIANALADAFINELGRIQSDTARRATVALSSRLNELRRSVVDAEEKVESYKNQNSLIGVNGRLVDDEYITRINDELARTRASITSLRVKAQSLSGAGVEDVVKGGLPEEIGSEALTRLRQNYSELQQQQAGLATRLGPRHPQRVAVEGSLASMRDSIRRELSRIVAAGQTELSRAETTESDLTREVANLKSKQSETSGAFVRLRELQREVDASRAVYEAFLLRARETSEQESLNTANIRVISEAVPPLRSAGPSRKLMVVGGAIGGFAIGFGIAMALAMLRLVIGFLRQDRRRAGGGPVRIRWTEEERAAHRAQADAPVVSTEAPPSAVVVAEAPAEPVEEPVAPATPAAVPLPGYDHRHGALGERSALRERIRELSSRTNDIASPASGEAEVIHRELQAVRGALDEIRRGRRQAG
ncbi:GumC family protein [Aureimonas psammosilenae]|uniref:GumC family protein n=1 Tax=Aureimonas psammosilenae TaxID=2495496 RepID=UPI001260CEF8|nr:GumC family protein [Aureimonas psammosilenae]